jgi:hypothetical protein
MNKRAGWLVSVGLFGVCASAAAIALAQDAQPKAPRIEDLAWLAGGWTEEQGDVTVEEHWIAPAGGMMLAVGRTSTKEKTLFFEFLRIETRKDGLFYVAQPKGAAPGTDFKLTKLAKQSVKFENPAHDFPKSLEYTLQADGTLLAHLEGVEDGKPAQDDFQYSRMAK